MRGRWQRLLFERLKSAFSWRIKLPGWVVFLYAVFREIPDANSRIDFWLTVIQRSGGALAMAASIVASPLFNAALGVSALPYLLFVEEPRRGAQRHPLWPIAGWSVFGLCVTAV